MSENVLRLENITMQFGGVVAINNLSMRIDQGEIVALIGPNGAGKTTAFNCITGVYEPTNGAVYFHDKVIAAGHPTGKMKRMYAGSDPEKFADVHVAMTPDRITKSQTAFENVLIATHLRRTSNIFTAAFGLNYKEEKRNREKAMELLRIVGLDDVAGEKATSLPYGKQRRLEIARALATKPTLLLLDEPAAGMNPQETQELTHFIGEIRDRFHMTILLIEHHMDLVMDISDRIYVLDFGRQIAEGTPEEIQKNEKVIDAYLGVVDDAEN